MQGLFLKKQHKDKKMDDYLPADALSDYFLMIAGIEGKDDE